MRLQGKDLESGNELTGREMVQVTLQTSFQVTYSLHLFHLIAFGLKEVRDTRFHRARKWWSGSS